MAFLIRAITIILISLPCAVLANDIGALPWHKVKSTLEEKTAAYGGYSNGCISGAITIPEKGNGYQLARKDRGRIYGHPALKTFIEEYGDRVRRENLGTLMVSDVGQPRGGPPHKNSHHLSHQTGLDVDIWYQRKEENNHISFARSVVTKQKDRVRETQWGKNETALLQIASYSPEVARIFVHPAIKKELCRTHKGEKWLNKIRPWWGHHTHFHVRLSCPKNNPECEDQAPPPAGDGCDSSLDWWFSDEAKESLIESGKKERTTPDLPEACLVVYEG